MGNFGAYTGEEFFSVKLQKKEWLIKNIIKEKDVVLFVGGEKDGKSIMLSQIACSITSGEDFLDKHEVVRTGSVAYVQLEGDLEESQSRLSRMKRSISIDKKNFIWIFNKPIDLLTDSNGECRDREKLVEIIQEKQEKTDLLILDPLYFCFPGKLSEDCIVRNFWGNVQIIKEVLGCAVIVVHHVRKDSTFKGKKIDFGDEATFGSKFLKAFPDHVILFLRDKRTEVRTMTCQTQRSGTIERETLLKLVAGDGHETDPLYFEITDGKPSQEAIVLEAMKKNGGSATYEEVRKATDFSRQTIYKTWRSLQNLGIIIKNDEVRPVVYTVVK